VSNKDTIIEALTIQLKIEREGNLALVNRIAELEKQEPLVWMNKYGHVASFKNDEYTAPLYTAPVHASDIPQERVDEMAKRKHEWVGLTDKEVTSIIREWHWMPYELCKVIEAKLKEKNT
jgi:hypothetical protein